MAFIGNTFARCTLCCSDFNISHGGRNDVTTHINGKKHKSLAADASATQSVAAFFRPEVSKGVIEAETRWSMFVVKHNLAFLSSDHASKLFSQMFPDSDIARKFGCARTKCTAIVKEALSPHFHAKVLQNMSNPYSIMIDESNDKEDKSCIILVRVLDAEVGNIKTRFLDMPIVNIGTASNIFSALKASLEKYGLDFSKAMAFMSDTANVMKGCRSGVQKLIKNENPFLYDIGCICHLADLCIKAGMSTLPLDIDQLFIDIYYYFQHSSKRNQEFVDMWHSFYTSEPKVILKHCPTRWLSLLRCIERYLYQLPGLISYFLSCEQTAKVVSIADRLQNPLTKPLLLFLKHVLPFMDRFNRNFQKSSENNTCELLTEINRLVRIYAVNVLTQNSVLQVGNKIHTIDLDNSTNHKPDENMSIGTDTWECVAELEEEINIKPFFSAVRQFYLATLKKMFKKFPFGDTILKDLGIVQPNKTDSYTVDTVHRLAKRFPQIELSSLESLDSLAQEFTDFLLSPSDLPSLT